MPIPHTRPEKVYRLKDAADRAVYEEVYGTTEVVYCDPTLTRVVLAGPHVAMDVPTTFDTGNGSVTFLSAGVADRLGLRTEDIMARPVQIQTYNSLVDRLGGVRAASMRVEAEGMSAGGRERMAVYPATTVAFLVERMTRLFHEKRKQLHPDVDVGKFLSIVGVHVSRGGRTGMVVHTRTASFDFSLPLEDGAPSRWFRTTAVVAGDHDEIEGFLPSITDLMSLNRYHFNFTGYRLTLEAHQTMALLRDQIEADAQQYESYDQMCSVLGTCSLARDAEMGELARSVESNATLLREMQGRKFGGRRIFVSPEDTIHLRGRFVIKK